MVIFSFPLNKVKYNNTMCDLVLGKVKPVLIHRNFPSMPLRVGKRMLQIICPQIYFYFKFFIHISIAFILINIYIYIVNLKVYIMK